MVGVVMDTPIVQSSPLTWGLLIGWVVFNAILFIVAGSWLSSSAPQYTSKTAWTRVVLLRVGVMFLVQLLWISAIMLSTTIARDNLLCLWMMALFVGGGIYLNLWRRQKHLANRERDET